MVLFKKVVIFKNSWNLGLFYLFVWALITGAINQSFLSIAAAFAFFIYFCVSVFLQNYCYNENKVEKLYKYLVYFSIFSAVLGIIEKLIYLLLGINIWKGLLELTFQPIINDRIYSTFGNPNVAGNWFAIMTLVGIYFINNDDKKKRLFYKISTLLFVIALCLTGSRGAYFGLLFGLFIFYLLRRNKKDFWIFAIFLFIGLLAFTPSYILDLTRVFGHELDSSFDSRVGIWYGCFKMIKDKPITGWGMLGLVNPKTNYLDAYYYETLYHSHNIWITFATTLGVIGLLIYLLMKFNLYKNIKKLYSQNCRLVPLLAGIQAIIVGHGLVDFTIMAPQAGLLFISCSAFISALARQHSVSLLDKSLPVTPYKSLSKLS